MDLGKSLTGLVWEKWCWKKDLAAGDSRKKCKWRGKGGQGDNFSQFAITLQKRKKNMAWSPTFVVKIYISISYLLEWLFRTAINFGEMYVGTPREKSTFFWSQKYCTYSCSTVAPQIAAEEERKKSRHKVDLFRQNIWGRKGRRRGGRFFGCVCPEIQFCGRKKGEGGRTRWNASILAIALTAFCHIKNKVKC